VLATLFYRDGDALAGCCRGRRRSVARTLGQRGGVTPYCRKL